MMHRWLPRGLSVGWFFHFLSFLFGVLGVWELSLLLFCFFGFSFLANSISREHAMQNGELHCLDACLPACCCRDPGSGVLWFEACVGRGMGYG